MASSELLELSDTALLRCCKVCKGCEEENKRFLICDHTGCFYKYYHISCLKKKQIASDVQIGSQCWYCPSCLCRVCLLDKDDDKIIMCDRCDQAYHLYCLTPQKRKVPKDFWECDDCKERKENEKRILMLHRKDYDADILKSDGDYDADILKSDGDYDTDILKSDGLDLLLEAAMEALRKRTGDEQVATTTEK